MEELGGLAVTVMVLGFAVAVVGLLVLIVRARDVQRRTVGLRAVYAGTAATSLAGAIFIVSRPSEVLPFPLSLVLALLVGTTSVRLAVAAIILPGRRMAP